MAQTKRKRKTKHRGNAAGMVEVRGRTGRKPTAEEVRKTSTAARREERMLKEPTWGSAATRAGIAAVLLFVLTQAGIGPKLTLVGSLGLCALSLVLYIPLGYFTDRFFWKRRLAKRATA
jgi:hypothetical protein